MGMLLERDADHAKHPVSLQLERLANDQAYADQPYDGQPHDDLTHHDLTSDDLTHDEHSPGDDPRLTSVGLLMEAVAGLRTQMSPQLGEHGLSLLEFEVLLRLFRSDGGQLRMADLATQVCLSASGITRVVDRLERDLLVGRRSCTVDRRGTFATITSDGRHRLLEAVPGHLEIIDTWLLAALPPAELEQMLASLRQVRDHVHPGAVAGTVADRDAQV